MTRKNSGQNEPSAEVRPSDGANVAPAPSIGGMTVGPATTVGSAPRKSVGEWAIAKGHDAAEFERQKRAEKRPAFRGDRHRGPDVVVVRQHKGWHLHLDRMGRPRTPDVLVTEAEYDAAVSETYALGIGQNQRSA